MTDVVFVENTEILTEEVDAITILTAAEQGPEGIQGPVGPSGGAALVRVGATPLSGHTVVAVDAAGELIYADSTNPAHSGAVLGLLANAYDAGEDAAVQTSFVLEHIGWNWAHGFVFVGAGGQPTQALPMGAAFSQSIGKVLSPTSILVDLQPPVNLA